MKKVNVYAVLCKESGTEVQAVPEKGGFEDYESAKALAGIMKASCGIDAEFFVIKIEAIERVDPLPINNWEQQMMKFKDNVSLNQ